MFDLAGGEDTHFVLTEALRAFVCRQRFAAGNDDATRTRGWGGRRWSGSQIVNSTWQRDD